MEAVNSMLQHSYGLGPPHGAQRAQGPSPSGPGPAPGVCPEEHHQHNQHNQQHQQHQQHQHNQHNQQHQHNQHNQQHHKPFFFIQPSQPYLPMQSLQWPVPMPMPVAYNPFYGFPGLGYGMPVMPHYQANPCLEPPGFVLPHSHLHLTDYRRMLNPQYYQTMAYHSRRFRYQQNAPAREMTSSEVQTEPLSAPQRTSTPTSSAAEASSVLPVCSSDAHPASQALSPVLAMQEEDRSLEVTSSTPPQNGGFVIQTEEVRIECCATPVGLQLLHAHKTAEMSHAYSQDVVQCSSILQGHVLQDDGLGLSADQSEQALQACPDILLGGTSSPGDKVPALEETQPNLKGDFENDPRTVSKNSDFKVVHLPFDPNYLDELRRMESTVWSVEETLVPAPESLVQSSCTDSPDEMAVVPSADMLIIEDLPTDDVVPRVDLEDMVPTGDEMVFEALCSVVDVAEEAPVTKTSHTAEVDLGHSLLMLENPPLNTEVYRNQLKEAFNVQDHQDTSFESLPAYLPSTSWLADFDNVHYCSKKMPPTPKKQNRPLSNRGSDVSNRGLDVPSRRRKLDLEYKNQSKPRERYKPKGKGSQRSLSDHECCLSRGFNENAFSTYVSNMERLCSRCLAKHRVCTSTGPAFEGRSLKRKAAPFHQWNDAFLPTCESCKSHRKRRLMRKGSNPDVRVVYHGRDTEGESSENTSCHMTQKWRTGDDPRKPADVTRPLASKQNLERYPTATYPRLREKNCLRNEPHHAGARERPHRCPHGNAVREMDENCVLSPPFQDKRRNRDQVYVTHRWQIAEKSCKPVMPNPDGSSNEARAQNKHRKSHAQGILRKDTRC
ncbi:uncharacterized protein LOC114854645 [Betta splendens]|uniref:Uncharacterized protein LOC114854645 n=1 Tax=Betta splendens TaxID=158456 RepID=A0A6P7MDU0_BETSP|nr:uncharacterized protein LOC114854645 [Betta splendens]